MTTEKIEELAKANAIARYMVNENSSGAYDAFMALKGNWTDMQNQELDFDFSIWEPFEAYDLENLQKFVEDSYSDSKALIEKSIRELAPKYTVAMEVLCESRTLTFVGNEIVTEENWFKIASGNEYPIEFAFDDNMTGTIEEDGVVYYNYKGMNLYEFQNTKDAYAYFFKAKDKCKSFEFKESFYIGDRDEHPTLDGWCKRMGIKTLDEEDGSSVYTDWKVSAYGGVK